MTSAQEAISGMESTIRERVQEAFPSQFDKQSKRARVQGYVWSAVTLALVRAAAWAIADLGARIDLQRHNVWQNVVALPVGGTVQGGGMPADQGEPLIAEHGDLPQALATEVAEPEIVVLTHQVGPARLLVGPHCPDLHPSQGKLVRDHSASYRITQACLSSLPP